MLPPNLNALDTVVDFVRTTVHLTEAISVPFYTVVWGFLGGIAWCLCTPTYWTGKGLFNNNYFGWYVDLPWIGALRGAATSIIILSGLTAIAIPTCHVQVRLTELPFVVVATLCLASVVAGNSARYIWKLLDRTVRKIFKDESEMQSVQSSVGHGLIDNSNLEAEL